MQGALTQKQLSNFKVRFCLACDAGISGDVLGNNGATTLRLGQVIANTKSTEKVDNIIYGVPLSEDNAQDAMMYEDNYFSRLLLKFVDFASQTNYQYRQTQKFYDEDRQIDIENLESLLEVPAIKNNRMFKNSIDDMKQNYMSFILGRKVVYSLEQYDIENFYISYGKNRCVLCISSDSKDLALLQKLVAINLKTMMFDEDSIDEMNRPFSQTMFFDLNPLVSALYPERDRLVDFHLLEEDYDTYSDEDILDIIDQNFCYRAEELNELEIMFSFRKRALQAIRNSNNLNAKDVCIDFIVTTIETLKKDLDYEERNKIDTDEIVEKIEESGCFDSVATNDPESILYLSQHLEFIEDIEFESNFYLDENFQGDISDLLVFYYRYKIKNIRTTYKLFKPILVMITGIENLERLPQWFAEYASSGMDYNILTMFFSTTSVQYDIKLASNYIFIAGEDPKLYDDYIGKKPPKGNNALKYRCLIKNTNQTFAFKKYRWISKESTAKTLNFDSLLG